MTPDRTWLLTALIATLAALFRSQDANWTCVVAKVALLVGASCLVAALIAVGLALLS